MNKYEKYQSDAGEKIPPKILKVFHGLFLEKIKEDNSRSNPDYEVFSNKGDFIGVCEVKSLVEKINNDLDFSIDINADSFTREMEKRDKNHRSKLLKHHNKAVTQIQDYNSVPTIVFFVSLDMTDHIDMLRVLNEYKMLYPDASMADLYILAKVYLPRIPATEFQINQTIMIAHNTEKGRSFAETYLNSQQALSVARLPVTIAID